MSHEITAAEQVPDLAPALETAAPGPGVATPLQSRVLALQRSAGNAAVGRMLAAQRTLARQEEPTEAEIAEAEAWAAEGVRRGTDLTPGAPGAGLNNAPGGFDAEYDPGIGELTIIMRCGVEFVDGIKADGTAAPGLEQAVADIALLPTEIEREQRRALFRWNPDKGDPERTQFKTDVESQIEGFWGGQHEFFLRKRGWSWLGATVRIDIQIADKEDLPDLPPHDPPGQDPAGRRPRRGGRPGRPGERARPGAQHVQQRPAHRQLPAAPRHVRRQPQRRGGRPGRRRCATW